MNISVTTTQATHDNYYHYYSGHIYTMGSLSLDDESFLTGYISSRHTLERKDMYIHVG